MSERNCTREGRIRLPVHEDKRVVLMRVEAVPTYEENLEVMVVPAISDL